MSEPLRIGILGAARISERALVSPAREGGHRLVAVAARDRDRARAFADAHDVERVVDSYADLVSDPESRSSTTRSPTDCTARGTSRAARGQACAEREAVREQRRGGGRGPGGGR